VPDADSEIDLRQVLGVVRRRGWIVVVAVLIGLLAGYVYAAAQPSRYAATAQVQVRDPNASVLDPSRTQAASASSADREVATQLELARSVEVKARARDLLGAGAGGSMTMTASAVTGTDLVDFRVESGNAERSAAAANAYAEAYVERRREQITTVFDENAADLRTRADERTQQIAAIDDQLGDRRNLSAAEIDSLEAERASLVTQRTDLQTQANELDVLGTARTAGIVVTQQAQVPAKPFEPKPARSALLGALIGLVLGIAVVFVLERLDDRVGSMEQIDQLSGGVPVLGTIPVVGRRRRWGHHRLPHKDRALVPPASPAAEAYRTLQTGLRFSNLGMEKKVLLVTSAVSGEGKTTCTANLAAVLAENGQRVVVVSADLRKPTIAGMFGVDEHQRGLTSVILGDATLAECLVTAKLASGKSVYVLPAGPLPQNPTELLASDRFGKVLAELSGAGADFVLVDCAPVLPVSDPLVAAQHVDGVLVMTVQGESKRDNLAEAVHRLRQVQADIIGLVVNGLSARTYGYTGYGYGEAPASVS
jgi:non-specific protein-tyrosine kinase